MTQKEELVTEARVLSRMLVEASEQTKAVFDSMAQSFGLPVHLARAIVLLLAPMPMRNLAEQIGCDPSYVTSIADQLEERGLIERIPAADRRIKMLCLTAEGTRLRDEFSQAVTEGDLVMRRLDGVQRTALRPLLEALLSEA